ncbi:MAG: phage holin family protein [Myxococcales bacterium]|nr:phage holin family protein [Myxococcales bacterium]
MTELLIKWAAYAGVLVLGAGLMPTVKIRSWGAAFGAAALFGVANVLLGWLITFLVKVLLFLPMILTLGLAWFLVPIVVNMILLKLADNASGDGVRIESFGGLFGLATLVSLTGFALTKLM